MTIFSTIGPRLANEIPPIGQNDDLSYTTFLTCNNSSFQFCPISSNIVFSLLNKLSRSKATGLDNISARFIRVSLLSDDKTLLVRFGQLYSRTYTG